MGVYEKEVMMSWTGKEYKGKVKAAKVGEIDEIEGMRIKAMFDGYGNKGKKVKG